MTLVNAIERPRTIDVALVSDLQRDGVAFFLVSLLVVVSHTHALMNFETGSISLVPQTQILMTTSAHYMLRLICSTQIGQSYTIPARYRKAPSFSALPLRKDAYHNNHSPFRGLATWDFCKSINAWYTVFPLPLYSFDWSIVSVTMTRLMLALESLPSTSLVKEADAQLPEHGYIMAVELQTFADPIHNAGVHKPKARFGRRWILVETLFHLGDCWFLTFLLLTRCALYAVMIHVI